MRSSRLLTLTFAAVTLAGCMQTGGPGPCPRTAPPRWQQDIPRPAALRPAATRTAQPVMVAQPGIVAQPLPGPMGPQPIMPEAVMMSAADSGYGLDSGDKLRIVVFGQDGLSASYAVDTSGRITMLLIGAVPARGRTPSQLQAAIGARLRQGYVREPHVAVEVEGYRPHFLFFPAASTRPTTPISAITDRP